nr:MAG TPA_asm: hypothetical protein [Caudoviricetes sp.]
MGLSTQFNKSRLCGDRKMVIAEPFLFFTFILFNERS